MSPLDLSRLLAMFLRRTKMQVQLSTKMESLLWRIVTMKTYQVLAVDKMRRIVLNSRQKRPFRELPSLLKSRQRPHLSAPRQWL
jgi:hypothetical protein